MSRHQQGAGPFHATAEFGAQVTNLILEPCACALCQPKSQADISACHAGMSDEEREDLIRGLTEDVQLYKDLAGGLADLKDKAYWCAQAHKATQARDALIAGRK